MASYSIRIDYDAVSKKITKAIDNSAKIQQLAYKKAYGIFDAAKRTMLKEFDRHNITQEILRGPNAVNISETLDGYGNLFSFIGFDRDDENPIIPLRELLEEETTFEQTIKRNRKFYFRVKTPTAAAIEKVTQMPWEPGNSWAFAVETYISGLSNYLYAKWDKGRSGMGIQLKDENWGENLAFSGQPYITEILANFRERINK